jgi:hypothetical protein
MLRANLYKKFSKSNLPKAVDGVGTSNTEESVSGRNPVQPIAPLTVEERNNISLSSFPLKQFQANTTYPFSFKTAPAFNSYTTITQPEGTITEGNSSYAPGTFNTNKAPNTFTADAAPFISNINSGNIYDVDQNTAATEQGPLTQSETVKRGVMTPDKTIQNLANPAKKKSNLEYNSMFTLGLGAIDMGLGYNEDLKNQRILNESIQNRQSKPLYDYNYMYGRTTSGGTEYQPTIKAEMGAQITKRFNTPYGANNVEIEGGEFLQLPNFDTEHAEGPSHEMGGIKTNLPEGTRVYSDHLKPEGSKKTFAQLAKKYDISGYKKTIDDPFKKQVDKDTATIMLKRNQQKLDDLFNHQQSMNGNSNGQMRDGGINNPGFRALPKAVQDQILANMEYGGYQLPEYVGGGGTKTNVATEEPSKAGLPKNLQSFVKWDPKAGKAGKWRLEIPENLPTEEVRKITEAATSFGYNNLVQTGNQRLTGREASKYKGFYAGLKPQDFERKLVEGELGPDETNKLTESQIREKAFTKLGIDPNQYDLSNPEALYNDPQFAQTFYKKFTGLLPEDKFRKDLKDDVRMGFEHLDSLKDKNKTVVSDTPKEEDKVVNPPNFTGVKGVKPGNYNKMNFPLAQAIPNVYGLAESQSIFPYAIPEINAPYIKPQTLNIQSQLQDIDNMGTAAVRAGADPLTSYLAGMDAKQKSFQTKQNYDAEGRSKADMFNAQGQLSADQMNASAFNSVYNNLIGQARDAQSAEKQAALANMVEKSAKHNQSENLKKWYFDNGVHSFDADGNTLQMTLNPEGMPTFNYNKPADKEPTKSVETKETKKAKKGMLVSKATSKKSLTKFK